MTEYIVRIASEFRWNDLLDIALLSFIFYRLLLLIQGTRTVQMIIGMLSVVFCYFMFSYLELTGTNAILDNIFSSLAVIIVVLFQGDLRLALTEIGRTKLFNDRNTQMQSTFLLDKLASACEFFSQSKTGALIVLENKVGLKNYVKSGNLVNAELSSGLLMAIFHKNSPLHDGSVILGPDFKIASAGCILPLSNNENILSKYGTRHRAAFGIMEESDARVIVVSEETGKISLGMNGVLEELETFQLKIKLYGIYSG